MKPSSRNHDAPFKILQLLDGERIGAGLASGVFDYTYANLVYEM